MKHATARPSRTRTTARPGSGSRQPAAGDTAGLLLIAARRLFARRGYEGTSVRAITAAAGANLGAITYHYGSKETLYHEVLAACFKPLLTRLDLAMGEAGTAPLARIEAGVRAIFAHQAANRDLPALMSRELAADRPAPEPIRRMMQGVLARFSAAIAAGQADGTIGPGAPALMTVSIVAQPVYIALLRHRLNDVFGVDTADPEVHRRVVDHVVSFIRRSLEPARRKA